jgi:hypothetical protein
MFSLFQKSSRKRSLGRRPLRRKFRVESLESRHCPSAVGVSLEASTADTNGNYYVSVQGQVMGSESSYQIALSGPVSANLTAGPSGVFSYLGAATGLGTITANVTDSDGDTAQGTTSIMDLPPQINNLMVEATGQGKQVDVSGSVTAGSPGGLTVTLSGSAGLATTSVTTASNGNFNLLTTASQLGGVNAVVNDIWGVQSSSISTTLMVMLPQINNLTAINLGNGYWQFQGTVSGPDPSHDTVDLSGLQSASATPNATGYFTVTVSLGSDHPSGTEYAAATDIWGQTGNPASYMFFG